MGADRLGKTLPAQKRSAQSGDDRAQPADIGIAGEQLERVVEPRARLQEQREIAGKGRHLRAVSVTEDTEACRRGGGTLFLDGLDRQQPQIFDPGRNLGRAWRREPAVHDFTGLGQGAITEVRHGSPRRGDAENFRWAGQTRAAFREAVIEHRGHAAADRGLIDLQSVSLFSDQSA